MQKFDVVFAIPGLAFNGETFHKQSTGGSESAGYYMARALSRLGHRVTVFCNGQPVQCEDVDYLPLPMFAQYAQFTQHDVCIVQRTPELMSLPINARFTALWCHDLALLRQRPKIMGTVWNYDKIFVLSQFMHDQYKKAYGLADEVLFKTRNGVDLATVLEARAEPAVRDPFTLLYTARPERGLDVLLGEIMPRVLAKEPRAKLLLCSYDNPVDHLAGFYQECREMARGLGAAVSDLGPLTKLKLYQTMHRCGVLAYPVPSKIAPQFDEISCITAMEAQACGLPVVSTARGALPETLHPQAGVLINEKIHTPQYYDAFADAILKLMWDRAEWSMASQAGISHSANLGWEEVAVQWTEMFEAEIRRRSLDKATLANHFWRRSDIYAAKECLKLLPSDDAKSAFVRERVTRDWWFTEAEDGFRKQYERIGLTHDPRIYLSAPTEPRFTVLQQWLEKHPETQRVLDYGCAHGSYALNLAECTGRVFTGVDIDVHSIELAQKLQAEHCKTEAGKACDFHTMQVFGFGNGDPTDERRWDAAVAFEVLEHVAEPWKVLQQLEAYVKDDGYVLITVPFGPWEYESYLTYPHRCHVWEFDQHDLRDMFDVKGKWNTFGLRVQGMPAGFSTLTGEPMGWWFVQYQVTPETRGKVGQINMERKLWLQRPRQTLSASIIAGPNCEETLHWCLRSLVSVADQIVVADCGLSDEAKRILRGYEPRTYDHSSAEEVRPKGSCSASCPIKVIQGVDPRVEGFETPRNMTLPHCLQDWVLWIDTDEKLIQPEAVAKYLRPNLFQGYSIRQHHFAVDTHFDADLPVRLFRNNGKEKWVGLIHEHPEIEMNKGPGTTVVVGDVHIAHVGYLIEAGRQRRFQRNFPLLQADQKKYPERILQKHFIMRDLMLLCGYELRRNGGRMTDDLRGYAREVVALYRKYFLGKPHFTNNDPAIYYSEALGLLGEGFDTAFHIVADKVDAKPNGSIKLRFASLEDAKIELTKRLTEAAEPFENVYW